MKNYKVYDISMDVQEDMMTYEKIIDYRPEYQYRSFLEGTIRETVLKTNVHCGTHMDAPRHMIKDGDTIEKIDLHSVVCWCKVFDLTSCTSIITKEELSKLNIQKGDFIILKTKSSFDNDYDFNFPYVDSDAAKYLVEKEIVGLGLDAVTVERAQADFSTHRTLMKKGINILEGLRLGEIEEGEYFLSAAPIKLTGADGAFVRAVLVQFE